MSVTLVVLFVTVVAASIVWVLSRTAGGLDPIDPAEEERWLIGWLGEHPRWGRAARSIDRRVVGGLMLAIGLASVLAGALVVGAIYDMVERGSGIARWDRSVADWGSDHATEWSTDVLDVLTDLGGSAYVALIAIVIAAFDYRRFRNPNVPLFLAVVLIGVSLLNNLLKLIVDRERPDVAHLVTTSSSSFPSGHSATAAAAWCAFALIVSRHESRRVRAVAATVAALVTFSVAASRALLGVHWLTDVIAGVTVGWVWFLLAALAFGGRLQRIGEPVGADRGFEDQAVAAPTE
jgi:membrane-associated phospholipid phosphatase